MRKKPIVCALLIVFVFGLITAGCSRQSSMTDRQHKVLNELLSIKVTNEQIKSVGMKPETARKFPAVDKMYKIADKKESYAFMVSPVGYRAPINIMVLIDAKKNEVMGIKVMQQDETPGWGEWLAETWFTDRFKGKRVDKYLQRTILEAKKSNEIIQITSATVTTQAVLNGVNSAMGMYNEVVLGKKAESVPLKVEGYITESQ